MSAADTTEQVTERIGERLQEPLPPMDRSLLSYLGLPFYVRHRPSPALARTMFLLSLGLFLLLLLGNLFFLPQDNTNNSILRFRMDIFGHHAYYPKLEYFYYSLSGQFAGLALLCLCILSPLLSTYQLNSERNSGTMEFLQLSPMPTPALVMGKLFAPGLVLHLPGIVALTLAVLLGKLGGLPFFELSALSLNLLASALLLHAFGGYFAISQNRMRGYVSLISLFFVGWFYFSIPFSHIGYMANYAGEFIALLSPLSGTFATLRALFEPGREAPTFFGVKSFAFLWSLLANLGGFLALVWASSRKLDDKDRTALPLMGWASIWLFLLFTTFGLHVNPGAKVDAVFSLLLVGTTLLVIGLIADHPHGREVYKQYLFRALDSRLRPSRMRCWQHTLFAMSVVLCSGLIIGALYWLNKFSQNEVTLSLLKDDQTLFHLGFVIVLACSIILVGLLLLIQEISALTFDSKTAQRGSAAFAMAGCVLLLCSIPIYSIYLYENDMPALHRLSNQITALETSSLESPDYSKLLASYRNERLLKDVATKEAFTQLYNRYTSGPFPFFYYLWDFEKILIFAHIFCWILIIGGIFFVRFRVYNRLENSVRKALARNVSETVAKPG